MYRVDRNNFYTNEKKSTIHTPSFVSQYLFSILYDKIKQNGLILDPSVGKGSLLIPFQEAGYQVLGLDIEHQQFSPTLIINYLAVRKKEIESPNLVIMNPPFNINQETKNYIHSHYKGRPLLPEIWFMKTIELFGKDIPIVMFTPYGFRLNQTCHSKRWKRFIHGIYPEIKSIISLPKDLFKGVLFHSEILIFNIEGLKGHYFCPSKKKEK